MKCSHTTVIHEAAHLVVLVLHIPDQHFFVQIGETGAPGVDAAVFRRDEWKQAPSLADGKSDARYPHRGVGWTDRRSTTPQVTFERRITKRRRFRYLAGRGNLRRCSRPRTPGGQRFGDQSSNK